MADECFIATAAFSSRSDPAVRLLRKFREEILFKSKSGQSLANLYYDISPPVAGLIARNNLLKTGAQALLLPIITMAYLALNPWPWALVLWAQAMLSCGILLDSSIVRGSWLREFSFPGLNIK